MQEPPGIEQVLGADNPTGNATDLMDAENEAHLLRIKTRICERIDRKYRHGVKEHGGKLWLKPMIENLLDEVADLTAYAETLKMQLEGMLGSKD